MDLQTERFKNLTWLWALTIFVTSIPEGLEILGIMARKVSTCLQTSLTLRAPYQQRMQPLCSPLRKSAVEGLVQCA